MRVAPGSAQKAHLAAAGWRAVRVRSICIRRSNKRSIQWHCALEAVDGLRANLSPGGTA